MKYTKVYDTVDCAPLGYEGTTAKVWVNLNADARDRYFETFRKMFADDATPEQKEEAERDYEDSIAEFIKEVRQEYTDEAGEKRVEVITIESRDDLYKLRGDNDAELVRYIIDGMFALNSRRVEKAKATFRERLS
jgi:hypothetical protein